jgi:hypothetical protein
MSDMTQNDAATNMNALNNFLPALSFEDFLVFLCAFSQLRFEGVLSNYDNLDSKHNENNNKNNNKLHEINYTHKSDWFKKWQKFMDTSPSFRKLLQEYILPVLKRQTLLAFPEDARLRDRLSFVFSIEVLHAIQKIETSLESFFLKQRNSYRLLNKKYDNDVEINLILLSLNKMGLVPSVISEAQVFQLVKDVLPVPALINLNNHSNVVNVNNSLSHFNNASNSVFSHKFVDKNENKSNSLFFPIWEWILCVVAFQTVETVIQQSRNNSTTVQVLNFYLYTKYSIYTV